MTNLFDEYKPIIYKLEKTNSQKILNTTNDILFSNNIVYPEINLGFHHFIHATKDKMQFIKSVISEYPFIIYNYKINLLYIYIYNGYFSY